MLNHDSEKRPSSEELLHSDFLPPLRLEEKQLNEVIKDTVTNTTSRAHRHLLATIFSKGYNETTDFVYDSGYYKVTSYYG